jgi:hypothetical protein
LKATKDFTKEVDSAIPEAEKLAQVHFAWRTVDGLMSDSLLRMVKRKMQSTSSWASRNKPDKPPTYPPHHVC